MNENVKQRQIAAALQRLEKLQLKACMNPLDPKSRPTSTQKEIFDEFGAIPTQWVIAGVRSGKTATAARLAAWVFEGYWEHLPNIGSEYKTKSKLMLFLGRTVKQLDEISWGAVKKFLDPSIYKEKRTNEGVVSVENTTNGNKILFVSMEQSRQCRERLQGYTADFIWVDEMPGSAQIITEAQSRCFTTNGKFIATFTPLINNPQIKTIVENSTPPYSKKYKLVMFDNPQFINNPELKERVIAEFAHHPPQLARTYLYGEWSQGNNRVINWDPEYMQIPLPSTYHNGWVHVEGSDPAACSKHGLGIWAQDPETGYWYLVRSEYIKENDLTQTILKVKGITEGYNIVKRVCDSASAYYIQEARRHGLKYTIPYDKNNRRDEMLAKMNQSLGVTVFIPPHNTEMIDEIIGCEYHEDGSGKIINSHKFHLLDQARYVIDCLPPFKEQPKHLTYHQQIREANENRKKLEHAVNNAKNKHHKKLLINKIKNKRGR